MNSLIKPLILAAAAASALSAPAIAKERVVIGEVSWDASLAIEHVLKTVMETHLDVDVEIVAADQTAIWASMDKGRGAIDVHPDVWSSSQAEPLAKYVLPGSSQTVRVNDAPYLGTEGFFIPGYIQDEYGVKSMSDLARPEIAKLFDSDGNGVGEYWPGAPGWGTVKIGQIKAKSYGFDQYFEPVHVADAVIKGLLESAYRKKQGILFYYWTPEWIHADYDLRKLQEQPFDGYASDNKKSDPQYKADGCWNFADEGDDWLEKSEIRCAWPDTKVYIGYSASLEQRAPAVAQFLKQVAFDPAVVNEWILQIGKEKQEPAEVAAAWVAANPDAVQTWLAGIKTN